MKKIIYNFSKYLIFLEKKKSCKDSGFDQNITKFTKIFMPESYIYIYIYKALVF
jgi:hypothetical protein